MKPCSSSSSGLIGIGGISLSEREVIGFFFSESLIDEEDEEMEETEDDDEVREEEEDCAAPFIIKFEDSFCLVLVLEVVFC